MRKASNLYPINAPSHRVLEHQDFTIFSAMALAQLTKDGFLDDRMQFRHAANIHYKDQIFELTVPTPDGDFDTAKIV